MISYLVALVLLFAAYYLLIYGGIKLLLATGILPPQFLRAEKPNPLLQRRVVSSLGAADAYRLILTEPVPSASANSVAFASLVEGQYAFTQDQENEDILNYLLAARRLDRTPEFGGSDSSLSFYEFPERTRAESVREVA
jgi:hypothetical protein